IIALFAATILLISMLACSPSNNKTAKAELRNLQGDVVGTATFTEVADGVKVSLEASNLTPGLHGIHVHSIGKCEPPDFGSAGAHFNPDNKKHGAKNPQGMHAGDIPNINVGQDGKVKTEITIHNVNLGTEQNSLLRQGGT